MPRHSRPMPRHNAQESSDRAVRGHWRRTIFFGEQWRTIVNNGELGNSDLPSGAMVRRAVSGDATPRAPTDNRAAVKAVIRKKAVIRVSCLVKTSEPGPAQRAPRAARLVKGCVSRFVARSPFTSPLGETCGPGKVRRGRDTSMKPIPRLPQCAEALDWRQGLIRIFPTHCGK